MGGIFGRKKTIKTGEDVRRGFDLGGLRPALEQAQAAFQQQAGAQQGILGQLQQQAQQQGQNVLGQLQGGQLDPQSQALISQEQQRRAQAQQGQQARIQQQFGGDPRLARLLGQQSATQSQLAQNPLAFQAQQGQQQRLLGQLQAGQAGRGEVAGLGAQGLGQQAGLLQSLSALAPILGQQIATTAGRFERKREGGLF